MEQFASDKQADAFETVRDEAWDKEWEKPEIKAWTDTHIHDATREQARELAKRWCNYAANISYVKSCASKLCGLPRSSLPARYTQELNIMYRDFLGGRLINGEVNKKELADSKRANMLTGWVVTSINIMKHQGGQIGALLKLLRDIAKGILSIQHDNEWVIIARKFALW